MLVLFSGRPPPVVRDHRNCRRVNGALSVTRKIKRAGWDEAYLVRLLTLL